MRNRQRGIGYIGFAILALVVVFLIKVVTVSGGPYLDYYYIGHSVKAVMKENQGANISVSDFQKAISTQFQVNNVADQTPADLTYVKDGTKFVVDVNYEIRRPFIGNCDVVFKFKNTYTSEENAGAQ